MTEKIIPALEARTHLGEIMKRSFTKGVHFVVEKSGIPMVAIINIKDYEEYQRMLAEREERFKIIDRVRENAAESSPETIDQEIDEAVKAVRRKKKRA